MTEPDELETFIPISRFASINTLIAEQDTPPAKQQLQDFFTALGQWRHQEYYLNLLTLKESYLPFSPDRDTVKILTYTKTESDALLKKLTTGIAHILQRANYNHIDSKKLNDLLNSNSAHGLALSVDESAYDEILVYFRGSGTTTITKRDWTTRFKLKELEIPTFKRLFLLLKLKSEADRVKEIVNDDQISEKKAIRIVRKNRKQLPKTDDGQHVYLKIFKDIPQDDVKMMFPNTNVRFKLFDKIKLIITAGGGTVAGVAGSVTKILAATATTNPIALAGAVIGVVGVVLRQVMSFFNTRNGYMLTLSQRLYFHSLADNRGALTLLSDRGEEEDVKEEMLLYCFLCRQSISKTDVPIIQSKIERYISQTFNTDIRFDVFDALERLQRDNLIIENNQGELSAVNPLNGQQLLEGLWLNQVRKKT